MRLFVGIRVEGEACAKLAEVSAQLHGVAEASYLPSTLYHLTLAYLGEREPSAVTALSLLLTGVAQPTSAFTLVCDRFGCFVLDKRFLLYASFTPCEALSALNLRLRERLALAGETFDPKPLVPHVTLARKALAIPDAPALLGEPIPLLVSSLTLFHSTRVADQLQYLPLFDAPLATPAG